MIVFIGLVVGFLAGRLRWWQGLLILFVTAVAISGIATAVVVSHPDTYPFQMSFKSFLLTVVRQMPSLAPGYLVGAGGRWLLERRSAKLRIELANRQPPRPTRVWEFVWIHPLLLAAVPTLLIVLMVLAGGKSNAAGPLEQAQRGAVVYLGFYVLFVARAAWQWRNAKPVSKAGMDRIEGSRE